MVLAEHRTKKAVHRRPTEVGESGSLYPVSTITIPSVIGLACHRAHKPTGRAQGIPITQMTGEIHPVRSSQNRIQALYQSPCDETMYKCGPCHPSCSLFLCRGLHEGGVFALSQRSFQAQGHEWKNKLTGWRSVPPIYFSCGPVPAQDGRYNGFVSWENGISRVALDLQGAQWFYLTRAGITANGECS